jgi:hypothetical protein
MNETKRDLSELTRTFSTKETRSLIAVTSDSLSNTQNETAYIKNKILQSD